MNNVRLQQGLERAQIRGAPGRMETDRGCHGPGFQVSAGYGPK